jgi:uncharacterized protein YbjQ (UPF0145 family)
MKANNDHELEYNWGKIKIKGTVKVSVVNGKEHHDLRVGSNHIAEYIRSMRGGKWDQGETFIKKSERKAIGKGNLLAGALLAEAVIARSEIRVGLREYFSELFGGR